MSSEILVAVVSARGSRPRPAGESDQQLIALWLHGRSHKTQRAYRADAKHLLAYASKALRVLTRAALQQYAGFLGPRLAPASRHR